MSKPKQMTRQALRNLAKHAKCLYVDSFLYDVVEFKDTLYPDMKDDENILQASARKSDLKVWVTYGEFMKSTIDQKGRLKLPDGKTLEFCRLNRIDPFNRA